MRMELPSRRTQAGSGRYSVEMPRLSPLVFNSVRSLLACTLACTLIGAFASHALGQSSPTTPPAQIPPDLPAPTNPTNPKKQKVQMTFGQIFASVDTAEPNRRAGIRSTLLAQAMHVAPVVIIVETPSAYLDAISQCAILYDDGTDISREHIARFVRAFDPKQVVRISGTGTSTWGKNAQQRQDAINKALSASFFQTESDWTTTLKKLTATGVTSPGVVVLDPMDHHWAAGLAMAAGRLQPIIYLKGPQNSHKELQPSQGQVINQAIEQGLLRQGLSFDQIGDQIDAITLAFRAPTRIKTGPQPRDRLALTDQIGRADSTMGGMRWAWCGQFFGSTSETVYQAMCALFLPIESAFIWDGYPSDGDWARYDGTKAEAALSKAGFKTELFDEPRNSMAGFRARSDSGPVDASLILMNTKGTPYYYDLPHSPDGLGKPGDLPMLARPSALHLVHSFSLASPHRKDSVGGRWLQRGVYLYAGSVDEPFLSGFVPTPLVAGRLLAQLPFAAAVHYDDGQAWKIAVIGDPLKTISPCGSRQTSIPDAINTFIKTQGGELLSTRAKDHLKAGQYTNAIEDFVLTNRDDAVVRLAKALINDKPEAIDDLGAKIIIQAAMRQSEHELVLDIFERLSIDAQADLATRDAMWFAARYRVSRFGDDRAMVLMQKNLRAGQEVQDAEQLAMILRRKSMSRAIGFLESLRPTLKENKRPSLDKAIKRVRR